MKNAVEIITVVASSLGLLISIVSIWNITRGIIRRLAIIQNRLNSLKGLLIVLQGRCNDVEKFLSTNHGYHVRGVISDTEQSFLEQYGDDDTGF